MPALPTAEDIRLWMSHDTVLSDAGLRPPSFRFRRWSVPIKVGFHDMPEAYRDGFLRALTALSARTGHPIEAARIDTANLRIVGVQGWDALRTDPRLSRAYPAARRQVEWLVDRDAAQLRQTQRRLPIGFRHCTALFNLENEGIRAQPLSRFVLGQSCLILLDWAGKLWREGPVSAQREADPGDLSHLRPGLADILAAAYDPRLPNWSRDPAVADRILAIIAETGAWH